MGAYAFAAVLGASLAAVVVSILPVTLAAVAGFSVLQALTHRLP